MAKNNWNEVTREDVIAAIKTFISENPEYPAPKSTFLVYDGQKLPAKHIRGMAYKVAFGKEIKKDEYAGGLETVRFFEKLGFEVFYTGKATASKESKIPKTSVAKKAPSQPQLVETLPKAEAQAPAPPKEDAPTKKTTADSASIKITAKGVIEQKNALQLLLNKLFNGDVVCEKTFPWMKTPSDMSGEYTKVFESLFHYRGDTTFAKKNVALRCDFVIESQRLIIEYDERQHFTEARRLSLLAYTDIPVNYDRQKWISACGTIQAQDNNPVNRDEIRAYYDSVRDIRAAEQRYKLVRIMHGQTDFSGDDAIDSLRRLLDLKSDDRPTQTEGNGRGKPLRVALYLQTDEVRNKHSFKKAMKLVANSDADILVLPEVCYTPFTHKIERGDISNSGDFSEFKRQSLDLSAKIGKPVVISSQDRYGTIFSLYANAFSSETETNFQLYVKHTMTEFSALDFVNYPEVAPDYFQPILLGAHKLGMTICYDCNHALFSRVYGLKGVDVIVNGTGGNVIFDKWYKYNQARAIENNCYTFVTMGGNGTGDNPNCYVFGFSPTGRELTPTCLSGSDKPQHNVSGGIYLYDTGADDDKAGFDTSIDQKKTANKQSSLDVSATDPSSLLNQSKKIAESIYLLDHGNENIIICYVSGNDILKAEKVLPLLYSKAIKDIPNRKYIIYNKHGFLDESFYRSKLSVILKVRAMENFCVVLLDAENIKNCYQTGKNRTAQVLAPTDGYFKIDLERASGPESIWKNKMGMRESWRSNFEWLINYAAAP